MSETLPDAAARAAALDLDAHVLVTAPAGSGKTGLLVHRMLRALAVVEQPEQVVAITFTNKAAAEIRARVLDTLREAQVPTDDTHMRMLRESARAVLARDTLQNWNLLAQPARLGALTIDAFCAQLGTQLPLLSGLGGAIAVAEDARPLYLEAITQLFGEIEEASVPVEDRAALARILRLHGNRLDRLVDPLIGLLQRREQWQKPEFRDEDDPARDAAALRALIEPALRDFSAMLSAADREEWRSILRAGAVQCPEKLSWADALETWPSADVENVLLFRALANVLLTATGELRKPGGINRTLGFVPKQDYTRRYKDWLEARQDDERLAQRANAVCALPDAAMPEDLRQLRRDWKRLLWRLAAHLRVSFAQAQQADFAQLAQSALEALAPEGGYGDALLAADRRIRHLLVDEMQDTSEAQVELLLRLTADWTAGDGRSLFLVGDPQQSIYAFRKAEVRLFLRLWEERALGSLPLRTLSLSANFRSRPQVVDWFNLAFARIFPVQVDVLRGAVPFTPSVALRADEAGTGVSVRAFATVEEEAQAVADEAAMRVRPDTGVAVLARTRRSLEPIIRALRAKGLTPACQDLDPLAALPEVRDLLALARALWHPEDRLAWAQVLRAPFVGLSWADLVVLSRRNVGQAWPARIEHALGADSALSAEGRVRLQRLVDALAATETLASLRADLADRTESVWHALGGPMACTRAALDDVRQALRCLREETRGGGIRDLPRLERRLAELYAAPRAGQIQMMTVHKAKGLEFDHVLLAGLNRQARGEDQPPLQFADLGALRWCVPRPDPAWDAQHPAQAIYDAVHALHAESRRNESLRLLYVAVTRAKKTATLYASGEIDPDSGLLRLGQGGFAALLAPVIGSALAPPADLAGTVDTPAPAATPGPAPTAPRLPAGIAVPVDAGLYRPIETRTLRPSEAVLSATEEPDARRDEGDVETQHIGTLYHEALQRIAIEGVDAWRDAGASRRQSMAAGLRRRGMPEPMVEPAVARVITLLDRTLASEIGRWLLAPRAWAQSEYPLAGWREGRWISAVIDRCFEDEQGVLWVVDYKTSARPVEPDRLAAYVSAGELRYRAQVLAYAELMAALRPGCAVRGALYFAEADRLVQVV